MHFNVHCHFLCSGNDVGCCHAKKNKARTLTCRQAISFSLLKPLEMHIIWQGKPSRTPQSLPSAYQRPLNCLTVVAGGGEGPKVTKREIMILSNAKQRQMFSGHPSLSPCTSLFVMGCERALLLCIGALDPARSELRMRRLHLRERREQKITPELCPLKAGSSFFLLLPWKEQMRAPGGTLYNQQHPTCQDKHCKVNCGKSSLWQELASQPGARHSVVCITLPVNTLKAGSENARCVNKLGLLDQNTTNRVASTIDLFSTVLGVGSRKPTFRLVGSW